MTGNTSWKTCPETQTEFWERCAPIMELAIPGTAERSSQNMTMPDELVCHILWTMAEAILGSIFALETAVAIQSESMFVQNSLQRAPYFSSALGSCRHCSHTCFLTSSGYIAHIAFGATIKTMTERQHRQQHTEADTRFNIAAVRVLGMDARCAFVWYTSQPIGHTHKQQHRGNPQNIELKQQNQPKAASPADTMKF